MRRARALGVAPTACTRRSLRAGCRAPRRHWLHPRRPAPVLSRPGKTGTASRNSSASRGHDCVETGRRCPSPLASGLGQRLTAPPLQRPNSNTHLSCYLFQRSTLWRQQTRHRSVLEVLSISCQLATSSLPQVHNSIQATSILTQGACWFGSVAYAPAGLDGQVPKRGAMLLRGWIDRPSAQQVSLVVRNSVLLQERNELVLEGYLFVMLLLTANVAPDLFDHGFADGKDSISGLPLETIPGTRPLIKPPRRLPLDLLTIIETAMSVLNLARRWT